MAGALRSYTPGMREYTLPALVLFCLPLPAQVPTGWQIVKDSKNACRIAVPPDWTIFGESHSAAMFREPATAMAVVTSQPGQAFAPLKESLLKILDISKEKLFENSSKRIFYEGKTPASKNDPKGYQVSVPGKDCVCNAHVTFVSEVPDDVARNIALSLAPVEKEAGKL